MHFRSLFGFTLLGVLVVSASCGSDNNGNGVPGFGVACTTDKECTSYSLLCGPEEKCVQCLSESSCERVESCVAGLCKVPQSCEDSRDCSGDQVCNETVGVCVQCLETSDCAKGQTCAKNSCVTRQSCEYTSDCDDGLLCDVDAGFCVACREDGDCPSRRICEENECVVPSSSGEGGEGGTANGGKSGSGGGGRGGTASGGYSGGGYGGSLSGGSAGKGGMSGAGGLGEAGAGPLDCDCLPGAACTPDLRCVDENLIDDFVVCDEEILAIQGRSGSWTAEADTDVDISYGYGNPGWADPTCAAWATGSTALNAIATEFAFIGFTLNDGDPYSLVGYTGLQIKLESENSVQVVLKTTGGGNFQATLAPFAGSNERSTPFASMLMTDDSLEAVLDLSSVYEVNFSVTDRTAFGLAIHGVTLY
jgi:hypothetical protein